MPPSSANSGLGFTSVPSNKENTNNSKKHVHESHVITTNSTADHGNSSASQSSHHHQVTTTTTNIPASASHVVSHALNKMSLKAREFGKEITNASATGSSENNGNGHNGVHPPQSASSGNGRGISSGGSMFSSTMHHGNAGAPLSVKHADAHFHHNHP